ncbi:hypothetical protein SNEBB_000079 [Seison nebaliae]|nr:hypothetical protein SNEBB_000079 [Seison nebaliae]
MNAFETELGVHEKIAKAINDIGWTLPTDIQSDSIPLILGGGDILLAAETGSGKTGAFVIPMLQLILEKKMKENIHSTLKQTNEENFVLNVNDRSDQLSIDRSNSLICESREERKWNGCRATIGMRKEGKYYFEVKIENEGLGRVGWSTAAASLDLGTDQFGFGYGGTGKKSNSRNFDNYGESFGWGDIIGSFLDLDDNTIGFTKNGKFLGIAFRIPGHLRNQTFFPAAVLKKCKMEFNFGSKNFVSVLPNGTIGVKDGKKDNMEKKSIATESIMKKKKENNAPFALILLPSQELVGQTINVIESLKQHLDDPSLIRTVSVVGGQSTDGQKREIDNGVDVVVGTTGRLMDFLSKRIIRTDSLFLFILDEVDSLLVGGNERQIKEIHQLIPKFFIGGQRLQMVVCSATLHNFQVKKLANDLMHFPIWVDLKGQDSVPDTVHHVICPVDPHLDNEWRTIRNVKTDGVHKNDQLSKGNLMSNETLSEAVKKLKVYYCLNAINKFRMDKAIIFCRTKLDCDNLEEFLTSKQINCICLHSDKRPDERKRNLQLFKDNKVPFLICTDVAARGIDVKGLPYVISVTLPDDKQNYLHRIGRVGRAERMGLAISLTSKVEEKVWYHSCPSRGKKCWDTRLKEDNGCTIWYNEQQLLGDIEEHLGVTINQIDRRFNIPIDEFDGKVVYGTKKNVVKSDYTNHSSYLLPMKEDLQQLEIQSQHYFLRYLLNEVNS